MTSVDERSTHDRTPEKNVAPVSGRYLVLAGRYVRPTVPAPRPPADDGLCALALATGVLR